MYLYLYISLYIYIYYTYVYIYIYIERERYIDIHTYIKHVLYICCFEFKCMGVWCVV